MAAAALFAEASLRDMFAAGVVQLPTVASRVARVAGGVGAGIAALATAAWVLRIEEFHQAFSRLLARVRPPMPNR
jgi:hypothetical protein